MSPARSLVVGVGPLGGKGTMTPPKTPDPQSSESLTRQDVRALMEEGRRLREELESQFRAMQTPSPEMLAIRVR